MRFVRFATVSSKPGTPSQKMIASRIAALTLLIDSDSWMRRMRILVLPRGERTSLDPCKYNLPQRIRLKLTKQSLVSVRCSPVYGSNHVPFCAFAKWVFQP